MFALMVSRWGRFNRPIANSPGGTPKANFVSKDRLYDVVSDSHKPSVRLFARGLFQLPPPYKHVDEEDKTPSQIATPLADDIKTTVINKSSLFLTDP